MKKSIIKYIFINIALIIIISSVTLFLSQPEYKAKLLEIALMSGISLLAVFLFLLANHFLFKKLRPEEYSLMNIFWIIGTAVAIIGILYIEVKTIYHERRTELLLYIMPILTLFLMNIYIKNHILKNNDEEKS